ncbi:MAG: pilus assembly PilX family protein [Candidatus Rokuibacteriota bacterium]
MRTWRRLLGSERGVALPLAMVLLMVLTMLTFTFMSLGAVEPQISRNLSEGARARQLAESGIEWAYNQLGGKQFNDATLLGGTLTTGGACGAGISCLILGPANQALPGLTTTSGTFTVTLRNDDDDIDGDQSLIGAGNALDTAANFDNNNIVILKSTGTFDADGAGPGVGASRTVTAIVERGKLLFNAAVNLPGDQADTYIAQNPPCSGCYSIDGRDWKDSDLDASTPTGPAGLKYGIATANTSNEDDVEDAYDTSSKRSSVRGKDETGGSSSTTGHNTIQTDTTLTKAAIDDFMANLAANPQTQILMSTQDCAYPAAGGDRNKPEGLRMTGTGTANIVTVTNQAGGCTDPADQISQTVDLGTAASPKMLYVKGEFDPASAFRGLVVEGSNPITGYGILVVEDSDLAFLQTGNFRWNGIVLVTGRNNSTAFLGDSNTEVRGAFVTNETNPFEPCCYYEFYVSTDGTMKLRASKENVDRALLALYNMRISAYRED